MGNELKIGVAPKLITSENGMGVRPTDLRADPLFLSKAARWRELFNAAGNPRAGDHAKEFEKLSQELGTESLLPELIMTAARTCPDTLRAHVLEQMSHHKGRHPVLSPERAIYNVAEIANRFAPIESVAASFMNTIDKMPDDELRTYARAEQVAALAIKDLQRYYADVQKIAQMIYREFSHKAPEYNPPDAGSNKPTHHFRKALNPSCFLGAPGIEDHGGLMLHVNRGSLIHYIVLCTPLGKLPVWSGERSLPEGAFARIAEQLGLEPIEAKNPLAKALETGVDPAMRAPAKALAGLFCGDDTDRFYVVTKYQGAEVPPARPKEDADCYLSYDQVKALWNEVKPRERLPLN